MPHRPTGPTVLSIDQGTTNSKAVLVDADGAVRSSGSAPLGLALPHPGYAEQDADEIWSTTMQAISRCLDGQAAPTALTISSQRESVVAWRRSTGAPLGPMIGWQDTRTAAWCAEESIAPSAPLVRRLTGLPIDPMFSAPKIRWLLDHVDAPVHDVCVGTVDSWLLWRLTGGERHLIEAGNAARTLLYDVNRLAWSDELLAVFGVSLEVLPEVVPSTADFGRTRGMPGLVDGTPIVAVLADSHAALYGQGCRTTGTAKATYGTGSSVMAPTTERGPDASPAPTTLAWLTDQPTFAREGNVVSSRAALAWTAQLLGTGGVAELIELAGSVSDSGGVIMVPALAGLGAPHWDRTARASVTGMSQTTRSAHLARAAVDAVAHQICDVIECIDADAGADGAPIGVLRADGGATASALLMQVQADLLGRPVAVAGVAELSAVGAAMLGLSTLGVAVPPAAAGRTFDPLAPSELRDQARAAWASAVEHTRALAGPAR